jgi:cobalt/nickel transport system permease protein
MHAPDSFFSVVLSIIGWAITLGMVALAIRNTRDQLGERQVPLMGIMAATIFAGQMLTFSIPGGTSGHLLGGALAAIVLGPWASVLVMTAVISIQALLFQDGGLLAMGLNIINMGIITAFTGYFTYRFVHRLVKSRAGTMAGAFIGGWLSMLVTSAAAAVELAMSGTSPLAFALPAMVGVHTIIGIGEGLLTMFALGFILTTRPDFVTGEEAPGQRSARWIAVGVALAVALTLLAPFASPYSDGMERVAEVLYAPDQVDTAPVGFSIPDEQQFFAEFRGSPYQLLTDYTIPFLGQTGLSTVLAGMVGVLVVFGVAYSTAWLVKRRRKQPATHHTSPS